MSLRTNPSTRGKPGIYLGIYGQTGKLSAANAESLTTEEALELTRNESRASDRAHAASMKGRSLGLDIEPYSVSDAEADLTAEGGVPHKSRDNSTDRDSQLLKLMSTLMDRLDILESNTAIHQSQGPSKATNLSVLRRGRHRDTTDSDAISSTARKHAESTRRWHRYLLSRDACRGGAPSDSSPVWAGGVFLRLLLLRWPWWWGCLAIPIA